MYGLQGAYACLKLYEISQVLCAFWSCWGEGFLRCHQLTSEAFISRNVHEHWSAFWISSDLVLGLSWRWALLADVLLKQEAGLDSVATDRVNSQETRHLGNGLCDSVLVLGFGCQDVPAFSQNKQRQATAFLCHPGLIWHFESFFWVTKTRS